MGINQKENNQKTEEQIKNDMKRKWDNFSVAQSTQNKQENTGNNNIQNADQKKEEIIDNQSNVKNEEQNLNKEVFLSLIPPNEENEEDKNVNNNEQNEPKEELITNNENENINNNENNTNNNKDNENTTNENNDNNDNNENKETEKEKPVMKKNIDYENTTIEKVFHITLDEDNPKKYLFLDFYLAKLLSLNQPPSFKLDNLDDIILTVMNDQSINNNLLNYFLECFHRAYEIIEVRFKEVLGSSFSQIHLAIATYFGQIVSSPESFDLRITKKEISQIIKNYYLKTNEDEFLFLFKDITLNCGDDIDSLSQVLHYLFEIMHMENLENQTFFKGVAIKKHLNLLLKILENYPKVREVFINDALYNPTNINGRLKQALSFFGPYISNSPLDAPTEQHRNAFKQFTNDTELKSYINKLNNNIELLSNIVQILEECNEEKTLNYFFSVINLNIDWQKTMKNFMVISSHGFLLNILFLSLNLFFNECHKKFGDEENVKNKEYKVKAIKYINTKFCLNEKYIKFSKFNEIYSDKIKDYIEENKAKSESIKYNIITKLFFICHCLMNYVLPSLMKFYMEINKAASQAFSTLGFNNPKTKELIIKMKLFDIYVKNDKLIKYILEFNEMTSFFLITLNNSKYKHDDEYKEESNNDNINKINDEFSEFKNDYFTFMDGTTNKVISSLPEFCILNIVNGCIFFRQVLPDLYYRDFDLIKNLTNFALIYSSRTDIIHNQHLRSQIFDIILYSFHMDEKEKNNNHILFSHQKLLKDNFIKENLIFSIMRVFIDAERLGTSNQFYERFGVRNKVLQLVNEVFKKNQEILIENIINYANAHSDNATQMITLLMKDVGYLIEEEIQRLTEIKNYQELKDNKELWNSKTDEEKKIEDNKFVENDRMLKSECRLLNHSLGFMTIICSCLQEYFIKQKLTEKLATLLNYCLDEFTSKNSQLNIKNKKDYEFEPCYIMESLIKIYSYFTKNEEFIEYVVRDERSYKYGNFLLAIKIKNDFNKVKVDAEISEKFDDLVNNKLKKAKEMVEKNKINYDDAPEEFLDALTDELMDDPVTLPTSKVNVDRKSIEYYLLTNPIDPFNRNPLTKEELIPNTELKNKIEEYKLKKMKDFQRNNSKVTEEDSNKKDNIDSKKNIKEEGMKNNLNENNKSNEEKEEQKEGN